MKTIEQAAKEWAATGNYSSDRLLGDKQCFKAGVKFAQEWINVDDELPEVGEQVLVKTKNDEVGISVYKHKNWFACGAYNNEYMVTHWRHIEIE